MAHVFMASGRRAGRLAGLGLALAILVAGRPAAPLAQGPAAVPATPARPSLLVVIVVDQFRADYVDRYGHQWRHGLRRIFEDGAYFTEAAYGYASTMTELRPLRFSDFERQRDGFFVKMSYLFRL